MYINSDDENVKNTVACAVGLADSHRRSSEKPLHFVQRLDYATSGALCLARNRAAAAQAGRILEARLARKYYLAVLRGHYSGQCCNIRYAIGEDKCTLETSHKMLAVTHVAETKCKCPRAAETRLLLLEKGYYEEDPVSVVLLKPITGRRHQLRVHCQAIGHTVLGDCTYGDERDRIPHRMFLHARRILLPLDDIPLDVETPEPFFSDPQFYDKWRTQTLLHPYRNSQDFQSCCDLLDNLDSIGNEKYEMFYVS
ncbi:RNA pseudouridylate synthase domain-containing protein 1 [Eumeta japonica]|uniref:RNA pseudouridylate synthase domain-containing protein 1 n=1 Tax=Eumeta variegata TaxID=151549 RepID=A0A4C1Z0Q1_EUMVA|nr:RNA pseudouridylate synthase domain-containing protein 1 [Eumeta japonica]